MTNPETEQRQAEIDARVAAATQGEWEQNRRSVECDGEPLMYAHNGEPYFNSFEDAEFIANAKPDLEWQRERIKSLESELAQYKRDTMVRSNYEEIYRATKRWQEKVERQELQIKALEAERADTEAARIKNWECFAAESKCTRKARKWARRWKRIAKYVGGRSCLDAINYYRECFEHRVTVCKEQDNRIAALENAAKSCATCLYRNGNGARLAACKSCVDTGIKYGGWVIDEKRFTPERSTEND